jgi:hypothetical protein
MNAETEASTDHSGTILFGFGLAVVFVAMMVLNAISYWVRTGSVQRVKREMREGGRIEKFIARQNIAHFTSQLTTETDPVKRELLQKLLTEEMVKQAQAESGWRLIVTLAE